MRPFESDMLRLGGKEAAALLGGFKVTMLGENTVVVEGQGGVKKLSEQRIAFAVRKKELSVCGSSLKLLHLSEGLAVVGGNITDIGLSGSQEGFKGKDNDKGRDNRL